MSAIHLDLEIDSSAYPELHQVLSTVGNPSFRAERIRQLAATGLIWERLRLSSDASGDGANDAEVPVAAPRMALVRAVNPTRMEALGLPVLRDEVPASELPRSSGAERPPVAEAPPLAESVEPTTPRAPIESTTDSAPSVQMSGTRARLMRMKRRGLFTNE